LRFDNSSLTLNVQTQHNMKKNITILLFFLFASQLKAQLKINELSYANRSTLIDEDGEYKGWLELYNSGASSINLDQYYLSDKRSKPTKFRLPTKVLNPGAFQIVYISSKNRGGYGASSIDYHWEGAIKQGDNCKYKVGDNTIPVNWNTISYNDASWTTGPCGVGYGDGDDNSIVPNCYSVYTRYAFTVADTSKIKNALLQVDYDDGFVAYLNGVEIARAGLAGVPPAWNETSLDHEAVMYMGAASPESFLLDVVLFKSLLRAGTNVFSLEVHNTDTLSSDLTSTPYLTLGVSNGTSYYGSPPIWISPTYVGNIHTNFQLDNTGDTVYLNDISARNIHKLGAVNLNLDESVGLLTDGSTNSRFFTLPTPGLSNNASIGYTAHASKPLLSESSGIYTGTKVVSIVNTSSAGSTVHFTVDGQTPSLLSPTYTTPITIANTTILKARCFGPGSVLPSATATATYIMNDSFTVPVYSINADSFDLYGWAGIISNPWYSYRVPCHIDIIDEHKNLIVSQNSSIRVDGGAGGSRYAPQTSFRLDYDHKVFGEGNIDEVLIPDKPNTKHVSTSYIRNGSNFWNSTFFKEGFMERCSRADTFAIYDAYRPIVVFINGQYFGLYELREKYSKDFLKNEFGCDKDSTDILSVSYTTGAGVIQTIEGSDTGWYFTHSHIMALDTASSTFLADVNKRLDSDNFADYFAIENWWTNFDWIWNNMKVMRMRNLDNRWKFGLQDLEWGLAGWGNYWDNGYNYVASNRGNTFTDIYYKLLENGPYRNFFINRYADLMNTDFLPDTTNKKLEAIWEEALPEWRRQILRWKDSDTNNVATHMAEFLATKNSFVDFLNLRSDIARDQTIAEFGLTKKVEITLDVNPPGAGQITISTVTAPQYPWTGIYFDGNPVTISAKANPGFVFKNWSKSPFITDTLTNKFRNNIDTNALFVANFRAYGVDIEKTIIDENQISIYPNPANNQISINMDFENEKAIKIYNESGTIFMNLLTREKEINVPTSGLSNGVYIVQIRQGDQIINKKLIVIH
jgi:CotH kinase protein/Secretion system C-terminal sorting domain/Chitobiase/beta-hexosaminidase C-terminal domain